MNICIQAAYTLLEKDIMVYTTQKYMSKSLPAYQVKLDSALSFCLCWVLHKDTDTPYLQLKD